MLIYYKWYFKSLKIIGLLFLEYFKESYLANVAIIHSVIQHSLKILAPAMSQALC